MSEKVSMSFTGEKVVEGSTPDRIWLDHVARYEFASKYVRKKVILDISCGTGYGAKILCDGGAVKLIGIDISKDTIDFANSKYKTNGLEFRIGDMLKIDFENNYFDVITSFETIEHVSSQEKAFKELWRVLKPKGLLVISSPNRELTSPGKSTNDQPDNPFHTKEYTTSEFIYMVENYFEILGVYGQRAISKLLLLPFVEKILRKALTQLYDPARGDPELEKISSKKEYRYLTIVCRKKENDEL